MVLQFWKFLSWREKQATFSDLEALDRKPLCGHTVALYVILAAHNSAISWTQQVTTALMASLVSQIFGT